MINVKSRQRIYKDREEKDNPWTRVCHCSGTANAPFVAAYPTWEQARDGVYVHAKFRHGWNSPEVCS